MTRSKDDLNRIMSACIDITKNKYGFDIDGLYGIIENVFFEKFVTEIMGRIQDLSPAELFEIRHMFVTNDKTIQTPTEQKIKRKNKH